MRCVGKINGEPVYEVSSLPTGRRVPVTRGPALDHGNDDAHAHRTQCLPCLFNSLIIPIEELEEFAGNTGGRILELDGLMKVAGAEDQLELQAERNQLMNELALASQAFATLTALVQTAAKWLP